MHIRHILAAAVTATTIAGAIGLTYAQGPAEPLVALLGTDLPVAADTSPSAAPSAETTAPKQDAH